MVTNTKYLTCSGAGYIQDNKSLSSLKNTLPTDQSDQLVSSLKMTSLFIQDSMELRGWIMTGSQTDKPLEVYLMI